MGLDCTHNAWHGSYTSFGRWRVHLARVAGYEQVDGEFGPTYGLDWSVITDDNVQGEWETTPEDALLVILAHSDCDGVIHPKDGHWLAVRLEGLLSDLARHDDNGHFWGAKTAQFVTGLRTAAAAGEDVEFW